MLDSTNPKNTEDMKRFAHLATIILGLGTLFRFYGIDWNLPHLSHPDEVRMIDGIWKAYWGAPIFESDYGQLPMKLIAGAWWIWSWIDPSFGQSPTSSEHIFTAAMIGRSLGAAAGLASIVAMLQLGPRWFGYSASYMAAFIIATSPLHIQNSHYFTVDIFLTAAVSLTLFVWLHAMHNPSIRSALMLGLSIGICMSCKASALGLVGIVPIGWAVSLWSHENFARIASETLKYTLLSSLALLAVYLLVQPEAAKPFEYFRLDKSDPAWWYSWNFPQGTQKLEWNVLMSRGVLQPLWSLASSSLTLQEKMVNYVLLWTPALPVMAILLPRVNFSAMSLRLGLIRILPLLVFLGTMLQSNVQFMRYGLPIVILISPLIGALLTSPSILKRRWQTWLIYSSLTLGTLNAMAWTSKYGMSDSRIEVGKWITEHVPKDSHLCIDSSLFNTPILNVDRYHIHLLTFYKWDSYMRSPLVSKAQPEPWFGELQSKESVAKKIQDKVSECDTLVLSTRMADNVLALPKDNPLASFYDSYWNLNQFNSETYRTPVHTKILNWAINGPWLETTTRVFERSEFRVFQLISKKG